MRVDPNPPVPPGYDDLAVERKRLQTPMATTGVPPTGKGEKSGHADRPGLPPPGEVSQKDFIAAANGLSDNDQVSVTQLLLIFLDLAKLEQKSSSLTRQALLQDQLDQMKKAAQQIRDQAAMQLASGIAGGVASFASAGISGYGAARDAADAAQTLPLRQQSEGLSNEMQDGTETVSNLKQQIRSLKDQEQLTALHEEDSLLSGQSKELYEKESLSDENVKKTLDLIESRRVEIAKEQEEIKPEAVTTAGSRKQLEAELENQQLKQQRTQLARENTQDKLSAIQARAQLRADRLGAANQIVQGVGKSMSAGFDYAATQKQADEKLTEQMAARYGEQADDAKGYQADASAFFTSTLQLMGQVIQARDQTDMAVAGR